MLKSILTHYVYDKFIASIFDGLIDTFTKTHSDTLLDRINKIMFYLPNVSYVINYESEYTLFTDNFTGNTIRYYNYEILDNPRIKLIRSRDICEYKAKVIAYRLYIN